MANRGSATRRTRMGCRLRRETMLEVIPLTQARQAFLQLVQRAEKGLGRYVLTKHGRPVAVLLGYEEYRRLEETAQLLADQKLAGDLAQAVQDVARGKGQWLDEP